MSTPSPAVAAARPATVTCTVDGRDHLVSQQAPGAGLVTGHGEYVAICGRLVVAAPLVAGPGPTCLDCETALHRVFTAGISSHRRRGAGGAVPGAARPGIRRLLARLFATSVPYLAGSARS